MEDKQEKRKQKVIQALKDKKIVGDESFTVFQMIEDINDRLDTEIPKIENILNDILPRIKGDAGDTPTNDELLSLITPLIPEPIVPENGKDYVLTDQDKSDIAKSISVPIVEKEIQTIIEKTEVIRETPIVTENVVEKALYETSNQIVEKINRGSDFIDKERINGLTELEKLFRLNAFNPTMGPSFSDLVLKQDKLIAGSNITIVGNVISSSGGGGGSPGTPVNSVQFNQPLGTFAGDANFTYTTGTGLVLNNTLTQTGLYSSFGPTTPPLRLLNGVDFYGTDNTINGVQIGVGNASTGIHAYSFIYLNNNLAVSADSTHYAGLALTGSNYNDSTFGTAANVANQFQLWNTDGPTTFINSNATPQYINFVIGSANTTSEIIRITNVGQSIGTTTVNSHLTLAGAMTATAWGVAGLNFQTVAASYTDSSSSGTVASQAVNTFGIPTLLASSATTYTVSSNVYIAGAPVSSTNVTQTQSFSLNVAGGQSVFQGGLATATNGLTTGSNFFTFPNTGISAGNTTTAGLLFAGASTVTMRVGMNGAGSTTLPTGASYANTIIGAAPITTFTSGTHALLANQVVNALGTITSGGATVTSTASLYVNGQSAGVGTSTNYALLVNSGSIATQGAVSAAAWGVLGVNLNTIAATYTDNSTLSGTVTNNMVNTFGIPTLAATNASITYTNGATVYIAGAPLAGANTTITNKYSLYIAGGQAIFGGGLILTAGNMQVNTGSIQNAPSNTTANFFSTGNGAIQGSSAQAQWQINGVNTSLRTVIGANNTSTALATGINYANAIIGSAPVTTFTSGNHAIIANMSVNKLGTVTVAGSATITTMASLYVDGALAAVGGATSYAFYIASGNTYYGGLNKFYNAIATTGWGTPAIYGYARPSAGQTAAVTLSTYTVGASDGTFIVSANILITTSTLHNFTVTCAYTDEGNTARVVTLQFSNLAGTFVTAIANAAGAVPYEGVPLHIRCKAATSITIATAAGGTYTTVTYNGEGSIIQLA